MGWRFGLPNALALLRPPRLRAADRYRMATVEMVQVLRPVAVTVS